MKMRSHLAKFAKFPRSAVAGLGCYSAGISAKWRAETAKFALSAQARARNTYRLLGDALIWSLWNPRFAYLLIIAVTLPIAVSLWWPDEIIVRLAGLWLQLLGIGTVAWGIRETRKRFGHPSLWREGRQRFRQWLRTRPRYGRRIGLKADSVSFSLSPGRAYFSVWSHVSPDANVEQRLEAIEKNLTRVRGELVRVERKTDDNIVKQDSNLRKEQLSRAKSVQEIRELLTATETGGLHISAIGAFLLFVGVVMSTLSAELANLLG